MRHYVVQRIEGLPPKKDGAKSMWNKNVELPRLIELRQAVLGAFKGDPPLTKNISLTVRVHVGPVNSRAIGDLDNFITGICDGLQAAGTQTPISNRWCEPDCEPVHPRTAIGILDDAEIMNVDARKIVANESPWYSLEIAGH
jgi:hypothetical protein